MSRLVSGMRAPMTAATRWAVWAVLLAGLAPGARAQSRDCANLLDSAHEAYVDRAFADAEVLVRQCLEAPEPDAQARLNAYRLLALIHLQREELAEAKLAVVRLLGISFGYEPDPVMDPPAYAALVASVKEQLRVEVPTETAALPDTAAAAQLDTVAAEPVFYTPPTPEPPSIAFAFRRPRALYVDALLGAGSYGGERGINSAGSAFQEYVDNSGFSLGLGVELALTQRLAAAFAYRAAHFPTLFHYADGSPTPDPEMAEAIDVGQSSEWVHLVSVVGRARFAATWPAAPYLQLGVGATFSRLNGSTSVGAGPIAGAGVDIALSPVLGSFVELNGHVVFPGEAVDGFAREGHDVLMFLSLGLRYRLPVAL